MDGGSQEQGSEVARFLAQIRSGYSPVLHNKLSEYIFCNHCIIESRLSLSREGVIMSIQEKKQSAETLLSQKWNSEMDLIRQDILAYAVTARHDFIVARTRAFGAQHADLLETVLTNDAQQTVSLNAQEVQGG